MNPDLTKLDDEAATALVSQLLSQLIQARLDVEATQRRAAGLRKMIDGLVEMFPATEDLLPEDFDEREDPRPRGAEAVRLLLADLPGEWYEVPQIVALLNQKGWLPNSSNPANAVRSALERLVDSQTIKKSKSTEGTVIYGYPPKPAAPPYGQFDEEPF